MGTFPIFKINDMINPIICESLNDLMLVIVSKESATKAINKEIIIVIYGPK